MLRFLFRALATLMLACAVILAVVDATRSVAASSLVVTPLGESWSAAFPGGVDALREFLVTRTAAFAWDPLALAVLALPGSIVLAILAVLLYAAGRRPHRSDWA